jgi:hypothetical protein
MGKKVSIMSYLYLIGMALVVIGFCCPMFSGFLGSANGFKFIDFDNSGFVTIGALLIFAGAVAGVAACFVKQISGLKLIFALVVLAGAIVLILGFTTNGGVYKAIGKSIIKHATVGFYLVVVGIVVAIVGALKK